MEINVTLKSRTGSSYAEAIYYGETVVVKAGGRVSSDFATHIRGGKKAKSYRNDRNYVDDEGRIIMDCAFSSPSTAAQFVTGRSTNGYEAWKVSDKESLGKYLKNHGLR